MEPRSTCAAVEARAASLTVKKPKLPNMKSGGKAKKRPKRKRLSLSKPTPIIKPPPITV